MEQERASRPEWTRWGQGRWHAVLGIDVGIMGEMTDDGPMVTGLSCVCHTLCGQQRQVGEDTVVPTEDPGGGERCATCEAAIVAIEAHATGKVPGAFQQSTLLN